MSHFIGYIIVALLVLIFMIDSLPSGETNEVNQGNQGNQGNGRDRQVYTTTETTPHRAEFLVQPIRRDFHTFRVTNNAHDTFGGHPRYFAQPGVATNVNENMVTQNFVAVVGAADMGGVHFADVLEHFIGAAVAFMNPEENNDIGGVNATADIADIANIAAFASDGVPGARADTFLDMAHVNNSDRENVHDSSVNANMKAIVERLRHDQRFLVLPNIDRIRYTILQNADEYSEHRQELVSLALNTISNPTNDVITAIGASESEVIKRVWLRSSDPKNLKVRKDLRQAFFDAAVDCHKAGGIVCKNGRAARFIASLTLLDHDERNWDIRKGEQYRNEILEEIKKVIKINAENISAQSNDNNLSRAAMLYIATTPDDMDAIGDVPEDSVEQVKQLFAGKIKECITEYADKINNISPGSITDAFAEKVYKDALLAL